MPDGALCKLSALVVHDTDEQTEGQHLEGGIEMKAGTYKVQQRFHSKLHANGQLGQMTYRVTVHEDGSATNDLALGGYAPLVFDPPRPWEIGFASCDVFPWIGG